MSSARSAKKKSPAKKSATSKKATAKRPSIRATAAKKVTAKSGSDNPTVAMCRELAAIVEQHTLSELIVDSKDVTLTIRRGGSMVAAGTTAVHHAPMPQQVAPPQAAAPVAAAPVVAEESGHHVTSPFVGTFYRSPNPDSPPYCEVGQRVEKGQVLCIVEAMKLMNEIEADVAGTLEAIMVDNGEVVEYGQNLFRIAP